MSTAPTVDPVSPPQFRTDLLIGLFIALLAAVGAWLLASQIPPAVLDSRNPDIYFSSDTSRVHSNMLSRASNHWRTSVHPLFSLGLHPAFQAVATLTGADLSGGQLSPGALGVARLMSGLAGGLAAALLFALLRLAGVRRPDTVIFCGLAAVSAFALHWFSVPETYPWGSVTLLAAMTLVALNARRELSAAWYVAAGVLTLSVTTTNFMAGMAAAWTRFDWRKTIQWLAVAFALTLALAVVQKLIYPSSRLFIRAGGEKAYVMQQHSGGPLRCWASFFAHTIVMPEVTQAPHTREPGQTVLRTQLSAPGSAGPWGRAAVACWVILLGTGVYALATLTSNRALRLALGLTLLGQLGLHTIYGAETFLYAAHYGPLMIAVAALATLTRLRLPVLVLAVALIGLLALNNFPAFARTTHLLAESQLRLDRLPPEPAK